jgi:proteic killer suppression protein
VNIHFRPKKLGRTFEDEQSIYKAYGDRAKKINQRLVALQVATSLQVIAMIPAARLHPLNGRRNGTWAVDIYKNWRICFEIANDPIPVLEDGSVDLSLVTDIIITSVEDYH